LILPTYKVRKQVRSSLGW